MCACQSVCLGGLNLATPGLVFGNHQYVKSLNLATVGLVFGKGGEHLPNCSQGSLNLATPGTCACAVEPYTCIRRNFLGVETTAGPLIWLEKNAARSPCSP